MAYRRSRRLDPLRGLLLSWKLHTQCITLHGTQKLLGVCSWTGKPIDLAVKH